MITKLYLNNNILRRRTTFRHLPNLQDLSIQENKIKQIQRNLLKDIALQKFFEILREEIYYP